MLLCFGRKRVGYLVRRSTELWALRLVAPALGRHARRLPKPRGEMALVAKSEPLRDLRQIERRVAEEAFCFIDAPLQDVLVGCEPRASFELAREVVGA